MTLIFAYVMNDTPSDKTIQLIPTSHDFSNEELK